MHFRNARRSLIACIFGSIAFAVPQGTPKSEPGLLGTFTDGARTVTVVTAGPDFALKDKESIDPHLKPDFKATWTGSLNVIKGEKYVIKLDGAEGSGVLTLDGKPVTEAGVALDIGEHPLRVEYTRRPGAARQQLIWSSEDFLPEPIPQAALSHGSNPLGVEAADVAERGRLLVESLNCVACHHTSSLNVVGRRAPDLTAVGTRLQVGWINGWLADPHAFRGNAMMPRVPLKAEERADITAYLTTLKNPDNKIKEQTARPSAHLASGKGLFESIGCLACHTKIEGEQDAKKYSLHGVGSKWLTGQLAAYLENPLAVDHSGRMPSMLLSHDEARDLAEYLTESHDAKFEAPKAAATADSVARGKQLVASQGCLQCHVIGGTPENPPAPKVVELEKLQDGKGCLAEQPGGRAMDYHLAPDQRHLIVAFIDSIRQSPLISASPASDFHHKVNTFGCISCHELDSFKPAQESERIPMLTNVGARMRKEWINEVLTQRKRVRPWLRRRMPEFGQENVGNVAELAVGVAGAGDAEAVPMPSRDETLAGQKLLGTGPGGLACVTCHGFAGAKPSVADDTRGPDMTTVAARLRPDHFRRWVYDPKRVNPSTPMPSFFEGVPAREAVGRIETILHYCALGTNMPGPVGWIDEHNYVLVVRDTALINRAVMPNLNGGHNLPRGIGVGLPGLVSYCFDADTCTVKYAWSGGFLDMKGSWQGRGGNEVHVMGKKFWGADRFPWEVGDSTEPAKAQFEGYSLVEGGVPQWIYRVGETEVKETVTATEKGFGIIRKFQVEPHGQAMKFILVDKSEVTVQCSGGAMEAAEVQLDPKKPEKVPAHLVKLSGASNSTFTVTLSAKEEK